MTGSGWRPDRPWRPTTEQLEYRRDAAARLHRAGYTLTQIQVALQPRVSRSAIWKDLDASGARQGRRPALVSPLPPAEPVNWTAPPAFPPGADPVDRVALIARHFLSEMASARWEAAHASDVLDARNRGDRPWLGRWLALADDLERVTATLRRQHDPDGNLRQAMQGWADSPPPSLPAPPQRFLQLPAGLREEVCACVAAGQPVARQALAAKYDVGEHVVQREQTRALARREMEDEGWLPPGPCVV